eukprot:gnl/MRDRNA2_/MRDRNA2_77807_c0_seq1.p1 gnl/MRDRNA2_/MRDRNA2_77807_c0~~gnl/MRDRNA2_/MRDRNA2_77807_c0_seq1.p1  ORF type:complete len:257 (-),score=20.14 gnl/MRDRNA2_/MRDRNA2_77807_c0_seq1:23-793(-)
MNSKLLFWRCALAVIALCNVVLLARTVLTPTESLTLRYQRWLGTPYVFQITWRSIFISEYVHRRTISSSKWNSPLLARILAAIGEFCFGLQLSLTIWHRWESSLPREIPSFLLPCLDFCGQILATLGTALQHNGFFFMEGVLWTQMFAICALSAIVNRLNSGFWVAALVACSASVIYMATDYCPMCWNAWSSQKKRAINFNALRRGFGEAWTTIKPTQSWEHWRDEWVWQTLYFSLGSWCSIWFMWYGAASSEFNT